MTESASRRTFLKTAGVAAAALTLPVSGQEPSNAPAPRIVAGPYLQHVAPDAATVMWVTDTPCLSWVDYGPTPELGNRLQNSRHGSSTPMTSFIASGSADWFPAIPVITA